MKHSFIQSFNNSLLSTYYKPDPVLGDLVVNNTDKKILSSKTLYSSGGEIQYTGQVSKIHNVR